MSKLRVRSFSISLDGYGAGPDQSLDNPLGLRGPELFEWFFASRTWRAMHGLDGGETGIDDGIAEAGMSGLGAWILGRNMFGPVRGPWPDDSWKGWWGDEPPYHVPVFVLTHHARAPLAMKGGTVFHFVADGIDEPAERELRDHEPDDRRGHRRHQRLDEQLRHHPGAAGQRSRCARCRAG